MKGSTIKKIVEKELEKNNGILYLKACWIARDFLPPGKRLGLKEEEYDMGKRGFIAERWIGSETEADNPLGPDDEGLSYINIEGENITLKDAIRAMGSTIMGEKYANTHKTLGRLTKIYDYETRIHYHIHLRQKDADLVGKVAKEEAYYFLEDVDMGKHPETFFGVHPYIVEQNLQYELLLPYLVNWDSNQILKHSRAYLNVPGEGFHIPSGILHAPGTALTLEIQEPSDNFCMLQAVIEEGRVTPKDLLFKDIRKEDREKYGEKIVLDMVDWPLNGDPYFYENRHLAPVLIEETKQEGGYEEWIYYNTTKFSGKKVTVKPHSNFRSKDNGVYNVLVWKGSGKIDGHEIEGKNFQLDEVLVTHEKANREIIIENTGSSDLVLFKFFGPDINTDIPYISVKK
jgi:mannose-6-phosphate isomerase class I